ncbi:MAG: peptidoglycan-binding protein, partial [Proteobacteria bacterium]|nr:peptidoglycan-binding protein [Pseudomonadota bacterium]
MAFISSEASAQQNLFKMIEGVIQDAASNKARKAWSRLPPSEAACVESALRSKGSSIDQMIQSGVRPNDQSLSETRNECKRTRTGDAPQEASSLSDQPTFDCSKAKSATGRIICLDKEGAEADWKMVSASWALRFTLPASERKNFDSAEEAWLLSLNDRCRLDSRQSSFTRFQRNCVLRAYSDRTAAYRSRLTGDALVEADLSPEDHSAIQKGLIALGLLNGEADGEFGEDTRAAIKQLRSKNGESEEFFLTAADRLKLLKPDTAADAGSSTCTVVDLTGSPLNVRDL